MEFFGNEHKDGATNRFFSVISKHFSGTEIPGSDNPVQIFADDRVVCRINDRSKPGLTFLVQLVFGYVTGSTQPLDDFAICIQQRNRPGEGPPDTAVGAADSMFENEHTLCSNSF